MLIICNKERGGLLGLPMIENETFGEENFEEVAEKFEEYNVLNQSTLGASPGKWTETGCERLVKIEAPASVLRTDSPILPCDPL